MAKARRLRRKAMRLPPARSRRQARAQPMLQVKLPRVLASPALRGPHSQPSSARAAWILQLRFYLARHGLLAGPRTRSSPWQAQRALAATEWEQAGAAARPRFELAAE
jgi:hypothetical protein